MEQKLNFWPRYFDDQRLYRQKFIHQSILRIELHIEIIKTAFRLN